MYFLSIESSTKNFALAVSHDDKVLRYRTITHAKRLENVILTHIDALLRLAKVPFKKIDAFVISLGPGSFTSLRVGLATVKAFCMATQKPMVGISSLDIIAHGVASITCDEVCVLIDARRDQVYSAIYQRSTVGLKLSKAYALSPLADVLDYVKGATLFVGDALGIYEQDIVKAYNKSFTTCKALYAPQKLWLPKADVMAKLGFDRLSKKQFDEAAMVVPIYLYEDACQVQPKKVQ